MKLIRNFVFLFILIFLQLSCTSKQAGKDDKIKICFAFQDLETEFWVAAHSSITSLLKEKNIEVLERNANQDANRQFEQIQDAIAQDVDGIIIIPQDGQSATTIIYEANEAGIPIGVFNRPPSDSINSAIIVVANNESIAEDAVDYMVAEALKRETKSTPCILVGDLGDKNSIERRQGFYNAINKHPEIFNKIIEVPTKWDPNTALANFEAAIQSNPNIDFIFLSSDFLYPQVKAILEPLNKWKKKGEAGHIILGGIDGDKTACNLMQNEYVDATGVQDLFFESNIIVDELLDAIKKKNRTPKKWIKDPGFALTQSNIDKKAKDMWGCQ